jgi:cysteine desulfurase
MPDSVIYLDNHATTRVDPRVVEAMLPYFTERYGNPGSASHAYGHEAKEAVEAARASIAAAIGAEAREIVFTSGATESNNLAIRGVAERGRRGGDHLISVVTEHKAVLDPLRRLAKKGYDVTLLPVEPAGGPRAGLLDPQRVDDAIRDDTALVSVMLANNEIGAIHPLAEIGAICKQRGVLLHCDATQAVGRLPVDVEHLGVDLMSFSGHKMYGPKGVGALYVRRRKPIVRLEAQIAGGGHEAGFRSGTLNAPGIVGMARALELCLAEQADENRRLTALRGRLYDGLRAELSGVTLNGPALELPHARLANNLNVSFALLDGESLMLQTRDLAVSSGSACTSAQPEPSHVLPALGLSDERARGSLRFGLGRFNTEAEIDRAVELIVAAARRLRESSSMA